MFPRLARSEVGAALAAVLLARTAINGAIRVVYPFLPEIAAGLGVSFGVAATLVAVRSVAGMTAPLVARAVESLGRRSLMAGAVTAVVAGSLVTAGAPFLTAAIPPVAVAAVGFLLVGLAKPAFDVPMQAWFGDRVPYARRGRVLGLTELTWAVSLGVTVPVSGYLIVATSWQAPFVLVAGLGLVGTVAVLRLMRTDRPAERVRRPLRLTGPRLRILGVACLFSLAAELLFVVYGRWLSDDVGLAVTAIGVFTLIVVGGELIGEGVVTSVSDRVGLRRMIFAGLLGSAVVYASLGLVGGSLAAAIVAVVLWFATFETTIVATVPFVSELAVEARDRLLSLMVAVIAGGRALGALLAAPIYEAGGITANGLAAAVCVLAAAALLTRVPAGQGSTA